MNSALFLTDCSVDSALALRRWLAANSDEAIRLTIVHPYNLEADTVLNKQTCRLAKEEAVTRLENWLDMVPQPVAGELRPQPLFASFEQALRLHLLLKPYTFLLADNQTTELTELNNVLKQTQTKLCRLTDYEVALRFA